MEKQLTEVCSKLGNIHERIDNLEQRQKSLEDEMKSSISASSSSSMYTPDIKPRVSGRLLLTTLQVKCVLPCSMSIKFVPSLYYRVTYDMSILCLMKRIS